MDKSKKIAIIIGVIVAIIAVIAVTVVAILNNNSKEEETEKQQDKETVQEDNNKENKENKEDEEDKEKENMENEEVKNPVVTMKIKDYGTVEIELYPDAAPNTVANFISLVEEGYYDGLIFHRIIDGFMVQGGDKEGTGLGEAGFTIPGEFSKNKYKNNLKHTKGVISMARADYTSYGKATEGYNSAATQFFIMLEDNKSLDGLYAAFGKVTKGMEVIEKMGKVDTNQNDRPLNPPVIEKATVETFGKDYGEPERLEPFDIKGYIYSLYNS